VHVTDDGVAALAESDTLAVLLPGTSFFLRSSYAPATAQPASTMRRAGA